MNYLVVIPGKNPFYTQWMSEELFPDIPGSIVMNIYNQTHTRDGKEWFETEIDHL